MIPLIIDGIELRYSPILIGSQLLPSSEPGTYTALRIGNTLYYGSYDLLFKVWANDFDEAVKASVSVATAYINRTIDAKAEKILKKYHDQDSVDLYKQMLFDSNIMIDGLIKKSDEMVKESERLMQLAIDECNKYF